MRTGPSRQSIVAVALFIALTSRVGRGDEPAAAEGRKMRYVEAQTHLFGQDQTDLEPAAQVALASMDKLGVLRSFLLPMPRPFEPGKPKKYDYQPLAKVCQKYPDRFSFLGGGGSLNVMIQEAVRSGRVTDEMRQSFIANAGDIARAGAVGYGEMAALHLSFHKDHPYIAAPPDHALFLLLAEQSAKHELPIHLHMQAVSKDMPLPRRFESPPNPKTLQENISGLERLLKHDRRAKIVWIHVGWDATGHMTPGLLHRLLEDHPNLYLCLKDHEHALKRPMDGDQLRDDWKQLIADFPDRFVLGCDYFYSSAPAKFPDSRNASRLIVNQLPLNLARRVAYENVEKIYGIKINRKETTADSPFTTVEPIKPTRK